MWWASQLRAHDLARYRASLFQPPRSAAELAQRPKRPFSHTIPRDSLERMLLEKYERDLQRWRDLPREIDAQFRLLRMRIDEEAERRIVAEACCETERRRQAMLRQALREAR